MSRAELIERIVASLQEAMLDDARWPGASALIDKVCGSKGNMLLSGDGNTGEDVDIFFARFCYRGRRDRRWERRYFREYHAIDERAPRMRRMPDSRIVHVRELYLEEELKSSIVYNELLPQSNTRDSVNARLDGPDGSRIVYSLADPVDDAGWTSERLEAFSRVLPHVRQFVSVRQALVNARALGGSLSALLENTRCGVIQLDRRGRIVAANRRAVELLLTGDGLEDPDGFLQAAMPGDAAALQRLLSRALPRYGAQPVGGCITLNRPGAAARLALHVSPVSAARADVRTSGVAALVLVVEPTRGVRVDPDLVAEVLGLTAAQTRLAVMLAQGHTLRDIAAATGSSYDTVRWHLKGVFAKHRISHQVQLVQLVLSLSAVPDARR